jgi:hypothetical protein
LNNALKTFCFKGEIQKGCGFLLCNDYYKNINA